jgi:hypothetical protein
MHAAPTRRDRIRAKIQAQVEIIDTGYVGPDGEA